jgi:hypothetical protein
MALIAERIYPKLKPKPEPQKPKRPPVEGWAKQRKEWGENVDQRTRGFMSPLGGKAKGKAK